MGSGGSSPAAHRRGVKIEAGPSQSDLRLSRAREMLSSETESLGSTWAGEHEGDEYGSTVDLSDAWQKGDDEPMEVQCFYEPAPALPMMAPVFMEAPVMPYFAYATPGLPYAEGHMDPPVPFYPQYDESLAWGTAGTQAYVEPPQSFYEPEESSPQPRPRVRVIAPDD